MITKFVLGVFSLVVIVVHACWKWGQAGGPSYPGVNGPGLFGPVFFTVWLLWPMFIVSLICVFSSVFGEQSRGKKLSSVILFIPMLLYGSYFLMAGGSGLRAGAG
jgi:hypothetical protein